MSNIRYNGFKPQITKTADVKTLGKASVANAGAAGGAGSVGSAGLGEPKTINTKVYTPNAPTQDNSGVMLTKDVSGKGKGKGPTVTTGTPTSSSDIQTPTLPAPVSMGDVTGSPNASRLGEFERRYEEAKQKVEHYNSPGYFPQEGESIVIRNFISALNGDISSEIEANNKAKQEEEARLDALMDNYNTLADKASSPEAAENYRNMARQINAQRLQIDDKYEAINQPYRDLLKKISELPDLEIPISYTNGVGSPLY